MVTQQGFQQVAVPALLRLLSPRPVYAAMTPLAQTVSRTFTPSLLLLGVYLRIVETQIESFSGAARWVDAIRDIVLWGLVLTLYFAVGGWIAGYMNGIYAITERWGSVATISADLGRGMATAATAVAQVNPVVRLAASLASLPVRVIALLIYYVSLALLVFVAAFMGIMHAIGYSLAFIYGLIAIPISVSGRLRIIRGWAVLYGFVLLWPVVQALIVALFRPIFSGAVQALTASTGALLWSVTEIYFLFAVLNLLVAAVLLMAPAIAYGLVSNIAPASLSWSAASLVGNVAAKAWSIVEPAPVWYQQDLDIEEDPVAWDAP